jgi:integrase
MLLTDTKVKASKPKEKQYKLSDGKGLYLLVLPTGGKYWHFRSKVGGNEKLMSFGTYPEISLADARGKRDAARKQIASGIAPSDVRKAQKTARGEAQANSFEVIAREWHGKFLSDKSDSYRDKMLATFERDIFPWIGKLPIVDLKAPELLMVLRRIESRGSLETAHRTRSSCSQVLRYAIATGRAERDCAADLKGALPPYKKGHHAAITDPKQITPLLKVIDEFDGSFVVKCALRLSPYVFVRPGELRMAEWSEFDLEAGEWSIPANKMKMKQPHLVPLAPQVVKILLELLPLTGHSKYVFPCHRSPLRPMSENALRVALRRMGYSNDEMTPHGFRAMARTVLDEVLQIRPDFIEHQLAHAVKDPNGRAYNRTAHLDERKKMMQLWADYLDGLKAGAKVIPFNREAA